MRFTFVCLVAIVFAIVPALAEAQFAGAGARGQGQGQGRGRGRNGPGGVGRPNGGNGGGNTPPPPPPNTLVTVSTPPPAATGAAGGNGGGNGNAGNAGGNNNNNNNGGGGAINTALIPPYGITAGVRANDGTANCLGVNNKGIPCDCPPSVNTLASAIQDQVARGAQFPTGNSVQDQLTRLGTCIVALQNFKGGPGSGVGCPAVSTTWVQLRTQLQGQL